MSTASQQPRDLGALLPGADDHVDLQLVHIAAAQANAEQAGLADAIEYVVVGAMNLPDQIPTDLERVLALYTGGAVPITHGLLPGGVPRSAAGRPAGAGGDLPDSTTGDGTGNGV